jgi:hypothetical protein
MHNHKWLCSDVPGIYFCKCSIQGYYNSLTKSILPYEDM